MSTGAHYVSVATDGAGAGSDDATVFGICYGVRVKPSSGSATVTITDVGSNVPLLTAVVVSADTTFYVQKQGVTAANVATGAYLPILATGKITITVASGPASGQVEVWFLVP